MNLINYLFENHKDSSEIFIITSEKSFSYSSVYNSILSVSGLIEEKQKTFAILAENSQFLIAAYYGIIASGNIAVPLNTKMTEQELDEILNLLEPSGIFIQEKYLDRIKRNIKKFNERDVENSKKGGLNETVGDDDLASIMFTSGSSGRPKGAMMTHKNIIANTNSIISYLKLSEKDIIEVVLPFYYCYGLSLLHTHTKVGGKVVLNNKFIFPETVIKDIKKYNCTGFAGVPSHYEILIKNTNFLNEELPSLKYVTQAGGKMDNETILKIFNSMKNIKLYIMYGQTEATARLSYLPPENLPEKLGSIGKGIPGVELKILDDSSKVCESEKIGELVALGENVMKGYYKDYKETEKKIKNGFLYTGDLAMMDKDGFIYIKGRADNLIKVGGFRISLDEITEEIKKIDGVSNCYAASVEDRIFGASIVCLVVLNKKMTEDELLVSAKKKLANYKVPSKFIIVNQIPLTLSGKIAKKEIEEIIKNECRY